MTVLFDRVRVVSQSFLWMLVGSSAMLASLLWLNKFIEPARRTAGTRPAMFSTELAPQDTRRSSPTRSTLAGQRTSRPARGSVSASQALRPSLSAVAGGDDFGFALAQDDETNSSETSNAVKTSQNENSDLLTADAVDRPPVPSVRQPPEYPREARSKGVTGHVTADIFVSTTGSVSDVRIVESDPPGVFDAAATRALQGWQFTPANDRGSAVAVWVRQTFRFDLN